MTEERPVLRFLDEGVPDSVGRSLAGAGHAVLYHRDALLPGVADHVVWTASQLNDAILVALDGDMQAIARSYGVGNRRYKRLSLIKLSCEEPDAARRIQTALSLIEHEWKVGLDSRQRKIHVKIGDGVIKTWR